MSGVFKKDRTQTRIQFYITALDLQEEITKYVMREGVLPKKWRYAIGYPLINNVDTLVDNITYANSIYPTNFKQLIIRKIFQTMAIANCYQIQNKLVRMERCVETVKISQMDKMIELIVKELELLKSWKKSSKIMKQEKDKDKE